MSASAPAIELHELALSFSYIDSGAPAGEENYPTFILLHGHTFYRDVWRPMFDLAPAHRARLIAVDRRGYGASTPYTPDEQQLISHGPDHARLAFMEKEAEALLRFVDAAIARCALPPRVVLVAWSAAVAYSYPLLGALARLPPASQQRVRDAVTGLVFFDPPVTAWGLSCPPMYMPITDESIPLGRTRGDACNRWFSIYWHHKSTDSHDPTTLCATEEENGPIIMGKWKLEEEIQRRTGRSYAPPIEFKRLDGCNHFAVWDEPEKTMLALIELAERK
ncbi:Alpha/Beta hydrolase protein [Schizophyllum fasciatum]